MAQSPSTTDLPPGLALAWGVQPAPRRGPKPAHSVEGIVATAMELADESGYAAVSMPKIASRLGITANALYRYLASKEELVVLLADTGWGPPDVPTQPSSWQEGVTSWVRAFVARTRIHPWLLDLPVRGAPLTPNLLGWLEALLDALAETGLPAADLLGCATLLDGYARSTANLARDLHAMSPSPTEGAAVAAFLEPLLRARGSDVVADLLGGAAPYAEATFDDGDVEFGLQRILDGITTLIQKRTGGGADRRAGT
ncbi:TetR/AcrR family transcriptional regulator [Pseudonocardia sp. TRM90224]|uniref:TetR/AcrR family transcriptional regulator n=1 Tax=Pseudonocardia sp. TRM90224 TaxID=2812678 RepID=UPI001E2D58DC|nr:TetR/AcrR family transcriptional regulator [Pseudonocardia sp. TRM90224]